MTNSIPTNNIPSDTPLPTVTEVKTEPTSSPTIVPNKSKRNLIIATVVFFVILAVMVLAFVYINQQTDRSSTNNTGIIPSVTLVEEGSSDLIRASITPTVRITSTLIPSPFPTNDIAVDWQVCELNELGVSFKLPEDWICETQKDEYAWINAYNPNLTITIGNAGRGLFCGGDPNSQEGCVTTSYFDNDTVLISKASYQNQSFSYEGSLKSGDGWVQIQTDEQIQFTTSEDTLVKGILGTFKAL